MRFYANISLVLLLAVLFPVDTTSKQTSLSSNAGSIQKSNTLEDDYPQIPSLFALAHTKERGALSTKRQYEPVPFEDSRQDRATSSAKDTLPKKGSDYLRLSELLEISLSNKTLIFPFHFHF